MTCEACGFENEAGLKFCNECGTALSRACPNGHPNAPTAKFCGECGLAISDASSEPRQAPAAERRFISVLFADLVGFTSMTESADAEDVRSMLTVYFERARAVIERFGGEVDKFIGDAITAFWGTTAAHEDDAERAVRAGLELVDLVDSVGEELGLDLAVRVGVLSGETAVGEGGNQHGLVIGDVVNTAARIQSAAEPGTVYVGESTHRLTSDALVYSDVGSVAAKGKAESVSVWRADAVIGQRGGAGRWATIEPPFVGREDELRFLKDQLHATSRDGSGRLVSIVGEPGIGKSRIAWELKKYLDGVTEDFKWHQGRSPAYGEGVTLWALAEMVRGRAGISEEEPATSARTRLRTCVADFVPDHDERSFVEPKLAGLLGFEDLSGVARGELFAAIRTFFQRIAAVDTVVMLFEDLHWADAGQLDFIEELVEASAGSPVIVVTLARPDLLDRRPGWGSARSHFSSLHLGPLPDGDMARLVRGLVPDADDGFVGGVVARAGGVPLYAVEFVRALVDSGSLVVDGPVLQIVGPIDEVGLPDSLHAVVGSRLDRLDADQRALVQDCAILGQSFTLDGLAALTDEPVDVLADRLRELTRREILRLEVDPVSPERGQYQFVQGVIREVAYGRIAKADRVARHLRVAQYFEERVPVEGAAVVADHYVRAYEIEPDEELAAAAQAALVRAIERAAALGSFDQALALAERGLEVPGSERDRFELRDLGSLAASATLRSELAIRLAKDAVAWADAEGSDADRLRATYMLGRALLESRDPADAVAVLEPVFDRGKVETPEMALVGSMLANAAMRDARWQQAADVAVPVMVAAERSGDMTTLVETMISRGTVLPDLGRYHEGVALLRESARLAGDSWSGVRALNNLLIFSSTDGYMEVEEDGRRAFDVARRVGHGALTSRLMTWVSTFEERVGNFASAVACIDEVDTADGSFWESFTESRREMLLWRLDGDTGHLERSVGLLEAELAAKLEPQYVDWGRDQLAQVKWLLGDFDGSSEQAQSLRERSAFGIAPAILEFRHVALGAAMRRHDARLVDEAVGIPFTRGRRRDSFLGLAQLATEVLGGSEVTSGRFEPVLADVERADGALGVAEWKAEFALLLDGAEPAPDLAATAHEWFSSVGDLGSLGRYADLFTELVPDAAAG